MTNKECYSIWAPYRLKWSLWVKPVVFTGSLPHMHEIHLSPLNTQPVKAPKHAAVIVDLPGIHGIEEGLRYMQSGMRPVPIYNGTFPQEHANALLDVESVRAYLFNASRHVQHAELDPDAPPVFMMDANRLLRYKRDVAIFDNSWDIYEQDLPSAIYFKNQGIEEIIVHALAIHRDLQRVLYKLQKQGIKILLTDGIHEPIITRVSKPPRKDRYH